MKTNTITTTAPTTTPITLHQAKTRLRISTCDEDYDLLDIISAATEYCQTRTNRQFITATCRLTLDAFPTNNNYDEILLLPAPVQSISSITYIDADGATQTLDSSLYTFDGKTHIPNVRPLYNGVWPDTRDVSSAVTVNFVAGYGDTAADVPAGLQQAVLLLTSHWYEVREPVALGTISTSIQFTLDALLAQYVIEEAING